MIVCTSKIVESHKINITSSVCFIFVLNVEILKYDINVWRKI